MYCLGQDVTLTSVICIVHFLGQDHDRVREVDQGPQNKNMITAAIINLTEKYVGHDCILQRCYNEKTV